MSTTSVSADEQAIRDVIDRWMKATSAGDLDTVLSLMSDDVVFMVPGRPPFGKKEFAESSRAMQGMRVAGTSRPIEIQIAGDWAWLRNEIHITLTPHEGKPVQRSGLTLTIMKRTPSGHWVLARDANFVG